MPRTPHIALVTCAQIPELDADERLLIEPLAARGITASPVVWDDPAVDWDAFDLTVVRNTWDYPTRHERFVAWAHRVPRLANPAAVIEWNIDKRYLAELADAGVTVIHTDWYAPGEVPRLGDEGMWVVKPTVSAGSQDTERYDLTSPQRRALAGAHVARLHSAGKTAMAQPYLSAVDTAGETALLYFRGRFSHAVRKGPMLNGNHLDSTGLYVTEEISRRVPSGAELAAAEKALAAVPGGTEALLYARVDLIPGADGEPTLLELELAEPSLFLAHDDGAAGRFADAVVSMLG
ncbi:ATP-grasp domain-containing protein [Phytomonospora endophytica]|uniref:ATP-grasp domain-containing protein n=1 Tax=Phytomonospora endophytica TaxID=714109 RepID=A0A841FL13_9ACTN|nr:hypothetical protein [Phytomonospora endophytica]MBB6035613.1 hypothetical protein [Phytomonospora endophytica]GIG70024.1 ATP-grasp domain-containing protein [Phytomonospora endophytica]